MNCEELTKFFKNKRQNVFFKTIANLFRGERLAGDSNRENRRAVMSGLKRVLNKDEYLDIFVDGLFCASLPFDYKEECAESIMEILSRIVDTAPRAFDDMAVIFGVKLLVPVRARKVLSLIAKYLRHWKEEEVRNPWGMLGILLDQETAGYFKGKALMMDYSQVFAYLAREQLDFVRSKQGMPKAMAHILEILSSYELSRMDIRNTQEIYKCLAVLAEAAADEGIYVKLDQMKKHILDPDLVDSVLNVLLVAEINQEEIAGRSSGNHRLLDSLLRISRGQEDDSKEKKDMRKKASLVLRKLAKKELVAKVLARDGSWMEYSMPTFEYTFKLFLVVFSKEHKEHEAYRRDIAADPSFPRFMSNLLEEVEQEESERGLKYHTYAVKIIEKAVPLTEETVEELSKSFVGKFIEQGIAFESSEGRKNVISFLKIIGDPSIKVNALLVPLLSVCKSVASWIKKFKDKDEEKDFWKDTVGVACDLCQRDKCARVFVDEGLVAECRRHLEGSRSDKERKPYWKKLLKAMNEDVFRSV